MSETVHATAVLSGADGVLIRGPSGSGKSTLALALIERGGRLIADDRIMLSCAHGRLVASASQATAGMIELRGRGILTVPHEPCGVIRLVVDLLDRDALERMPEAAQLSVALLGVDLPRQPVPAVDFGAIRLVEAALAALSRRPAEGNSGRGLANPASFAMMTPPPTPTASS
jgi:serine kinase of HPr protein (carbohydrate metabolism regulator)